MYIYNYIHIMHFRYVLQKLVCPKIQVVIIIYCQQFLGLWHEANTSQHDSGTSAMPAVSSEACAVE